MIRTARPQPLLRNTPIARPHVRELVVQLGHPLTRAKNSGIVSAYVALATIAVGLLSLDFSPPPSGYRPALAQQKSAVKAVTLRVSALVAGALASR